MGKLIPVNMVEVDINATAYVNVGSVINEITSGNPTIAMVKQVDLTFKTGFLIESHSSDTTSVLVWTVIGEIKEYMIVVSPEDVGQAYLIQRAIGISMLIGGLMDSSEIKNVQKIPLLGNIPILGEFFKYSYKSGNKR